MKKSTVLMMLAALMGLLALGLFISCGEKFSETPTTPSQVSTSLLKAPTCAGATESSPESDGGITPYIIPGANKGGNRTCVEVDSCFEESYDNSSDRLNYEDHPTGGTVGPITWTTDGTYVCWESSVPVKVAVIVKGSNDANVYVYDECTSSDCGLAPPPNASGDPAGLSNITFCWTECEEEECRDETAFGGDSEGPTGCGPAWWFYFDTEGDECQAIYAGQQVMGGGSVCYDSYNDVLTITLGPGWSLDDGDETVKVQGYGEGELPDCRPNAGHFTTFKGTSLTVQGDGSRYYVIHLDVKFCQ
jgi:hypothetical protein